MRYHKNIFNHGGFRIPITEAYLVEEGQTKAVWVGSDEELKNMTASDEISEYLTSYPETEMSDHEIHSRLKKVFSFGIEEILEDFSEGEIVAGISFWWKGDIYHTDGKFDSSKPFDPQYDSFIKWFVEKEGE